MPAGIEREAHRFPVIFNNLASITVEALSVLSVVIIDLHENHFNQPSRSFRAASFPCSCFSLEALVNVMIGFYELQYCCRVGEKLIIKAGETVDDW